MPGTSPDTLSIVCNELKTIGRHPVADFCNAFLELTDHTIYVTGKTVQVGLRVIIKQ